MRSDAVANQLKIVNAATRLMAEQGLDAELTDIAHEAGVGIGTVYRCVGNRDQVIETIVKDMVRQLTVSFKKAENQENVAETLLELIEQLHEIVGTYGWVHAALIGGRMAALRGEMHAIDPVGRLELLCKRGRSEGSLRADIEPTVTAALILGSLSPWSALSLRIRGDARVVAQEVLRPFLAHTTKGTTTCA